MLIYRGEDDDKKDDGGEIVSSVRIFRRTLSTGPNSPPIEAGGIGEVCTSPNHQRRGLSKLLLKDALRIMGSGNEGMACSLLHSSPDFRPVYRKVGGYECVKSEWSLVPIILQNLSTAKIIPAGEHAEWSIRRANFPDDVSRLMELHKEYSEKRFAGCVVRSENYWKEYVRAELGDTLWVMTERKIGLTAGEEEGDRIVAWISIRKRGDRFQLREFGVDIIGSGKTNVAEAIKSLLGVALHDAGESGVGSRHEGEMPLLSLPTVVLSEILDLHVLLSRISPASHTFCFDMNHVTVEDDDGWMYVIFDKTKASIFELTTRDKNPVPHLIWPTDSF